MTAQDVARKVGTNLAVVAAAIDRGHLKAKRVPKTYSRSVHKMVWFVERADFEEWREFYETHKYLYKTHQLHKKTDEMCIVSPEIECITQGSCSGCGMLKHQPPKLLGAQNYSESAIDNGRQKPDGITGNAYNGR